MVGTHGEANRNPRRGRSEWAWGWARSGCVQEGCGGRSFLSPAARRGRGRRGVSVCRCRSPYLPRPNGGAPLDASAAGPQRKRSVGVSLPLSLSSAAVWWFCGGAKDQIRRGVWEVDACEVQKASQVAACPCPRSLGGGLGGVRRPADGGRGGKARLCVSGAPCCWRGAPCSTSRRGCASGRAPAGSRMNAKAYPCSRHTVRGGNTVGFSR